MASEARASCTLDMAQDQRATSFHHCGLHKKARQKMLPPITTKETRGKVGIPQEGQKEPGTLPGRQRGSQKLELSRDCDVRRGSSVLFAA